nr:hypothetical protein Iba_chr06eCG0510 [Ipomoea batatas]
MTAPRASRPPLLLSKHTKSYVIPIPQFPAFLAPKAGVPRKLAMEAKQHLAAGALGPLHSPAALIHDQNRAVAIGAGPARNRVEKLAAIQSRALDFGGVAFKLHGNHRLDADFAGEWLVLSSVFRVKPCGWGFLALLRPPRKSSQSVSHDHTFTLSVCSRFSLRVLATLLASEEVNSSRFRFLFCAP